MHLGGTDESDEGNWEWISGRCSFSSFVNWNINEPNNGGTAGEHCNEMRLWDNGMFGWNDVRCTVSKAFICEFDLNVI